MKKTYFLTLFLFFIAITAIAQTNQIQVFNEILFYDGYAAVVDHPVPDGVLRHKNSLYATRLSEEQLASFGEETTMHVIIKAACDNYDRIGNVNLALVPKGEDTYQPENVSRIEIGRYITPFMNKNKQPDEVPYQYEVNFIKHILKEESLLAEYDFWIELELFGVPYAANKEIAGCAGRNDVFYGTLYFETSTPAVGLEDDNVLIPLFFKRRFNNYQENATDELGRTLRTIEFDLENDLENVRLVLITSNHGAASGGEEYKRRMHYVYFDGEEVLQYKPGRTSCEPFRQYNTQGNGIYGYYKKTDAEWQSFSNWCPGDVIDNRIIEIEHLEKGTHTFRIEVPDAVFKGKDGNFPLSLFLLGKKASGSSLLEVKGSDIRIFPNPVDRELTISPVADINKIMIADLTGRIVYQGKAMQTMDLTSYTPGIYNLILTTNNGKLYTRKLIKR